MGRKKATLKERSDRMTQRRRFRYDDNKPFIELLKPEYQHLLIVGEIAQKLKSLLHNGNNINVRNLIFLYFKLPSAASDNKQCCTHKEVYQWLAQLLKATGSKGTMYGKSMIFRYITKGHSNLSLSESSLQSLVNKELVKML